MHVSPPMNETCVMGRFFTLLKFSKNNFKCFSSCFHQIYILVLKNIHTLKQPKVFISWLKQITFRVCYDLKKKQQNILDQEDVIDETLIFVTDEHVDNNPEAKIMMKTKQTKIKEAINQLPSLERDALLMKFVSNMKQEEIAKSMGCSLSSVKRYLTNGRKHLYQFQLEEEN